MTEIDDIIIVGGGPVGLFAGFYAGMRNARVKIIESLGQVGGQPRLLYPKKNIYDIPAYPSINGQELSHRLIEQISRFNLEVCLNEEVQTIEWLEEEEAYLLRSQDGEHRGRSIILAVGGGAFQARKLKLEEAASFEKTNLHYLVKDLESYRNLDVVINGGGDSAVDWALALEPIAKTVSLVHRRDKFRALDYSVQQLKESDIRLLTPYEPHGIEADGDRIKVMLFKERRGEDIQRLEADAFIVSYGFQSSLGAIQDWPLEKSAGRIQVDYKMESSLDRVFAIGDVCDYPGKIDLIATGFGEAPIAVNHAIHSIHPDQSIKPQQSTSLGLEEDGHV